MPDAVPAAAPTDNHRGRRWRRRIAILAAPAIAALLFGWLWPDDLTREDPWFVRISWLAFLVRTFTFHIGLGLLALAVLALPLRAFLASAALAAVAAPTLWPAASGLFARSADAAGRPTLTVMSVNLLYGRAASDQLLNAVREISPDVIVFQEYTTTSTTSLPGLLGDLYPHRAEAPRDDAFGQAVYARLPFDTPPRLFPPSTVFNDPQILAEFTFDGAPVRIMNVHLRPPVGLALITEQRRQTLALADLTCQQIAALPPDGALIIAGDLNATPESRHLALLRSAGLAEANAGFGRGPTWPRTTYLRYLPGVRIDHILYAGPLRCIESGVGPDNGSDHRPTYARFVRGR